MDEIRHIRPQTAVHPPEGLDLQADEIGALRGTQELVFRAAGAIGGSVEALDEDVAEEGAGVAVVILQA